MNAASMDPHPRPGPDLFGSRSFRLDAEASFTIRHPGRDAVDAAAGLEDEIVRIYAIGGHEVADRSSLAIRSTIRIDDPTSPLVRFDTPCGAASAFDAAESELHVTRSSVGAHARPLIQARMRAALRALDAWCVRFDIDGTTLVIEDQADTIVEHGTLVCLTSGLVHLAGPTPTTILEWSDVAAILVPEMKGHRITMLKLDGTILHIAPGGIR
jgi:hypothetical protein